MRAAIPTLTALFAATGLVVAACAPPKPPKPKPKAAALDADDDAELAAADSEARDEPEPPAVEATPTADAAPDAAPDAATKAGALPPVDAVAAQRLADALRHADEGNESRIAAAGLAEIEAERLPDFMIRALKDYADVVPEQRSVVVSRELGDEEGQAAWNQACSGGVVVFQKVAVAAPSERAKLLWGECDLERLGIFDAETIADADPSALLLAVLAADRLQRADALSDAETVAITALTTAPAER
ncbi:MAG: hypothetical protein R3A79_27660 [Nannocystaceae bacterium]